MPTTYDDSQPPDPNLKHSSPESASSPAHSGKEARDGITSIRSPYRPEEVVKSSPPKEQPENSTERRQAQEPGKTPNFSVMEKTLRDPGSNPFLLWWNRLQKPVNRKAVGQGEEKWPAIIRRARLIVGFSLVGTGAIAAVVVFRNPLLRGHISKLADRAWADTLAKTSQTNLSVILFLLAFPIAAFVIGIFLHPREGLTERVKEAILPALVGLLVPLCGFGIVFAWSFAHTDYDQHIELSRANEKLTNERDEYKQQTDRIPALEQQIKDLKREYGKEPKAISRTGQVPRPARDSHDDVAQIQAAVHRVLSFPNAIPDSKSQTMTESMLTNKTPRKLFDALVQYDENSVGSVPNSGPMLREFLHRYYEFQGKVEAVEKKSLEKIGGMVAVRFSAGWEMYLQYAILRFSGHPKDQIAKGSNFLNYSITWDDAERVYIELANDPSITEGFQDVLSRYEGFTQTVERLAAIQ